MMATRYRPIATEAGIVVCAPVHDAFLIEADLDALDEAISDMREIMAEAFLHIYPDHPDIGLADASIGPDWAATKAWRPAPPVTDTGPCTTDHAP